MKKRMMIFVICILCAVLLVGCAPNKPSSGGASQPIISGKQQSANEINVLTGGERPEGMIDGQRPVAVMVANDSNALPQQGISQADVIYEMVTEGGITRLMAMFADYRTVPKVGPVRSIRDAFVQFAVPSDAILAHIGTSIYAKNLLNVLKYQDLDGIYLGTTAYFFDEALALPRPNGKGNEYCWFTDASYLWQGMEQIDVMTTGSVPTLFNFGKNLGYTGEEALSVEITYSPVSTVTFRYDPESKLYSKTIFGNPHADASGAVLAFTNVLILQTDITLKPDGFCTQFDLQEGDGMLFSGGVAQQVRWQKGGPNEQLELFDMRGKPFVMEAGRSYIGITGLDAPVYSNGEPVPPATEEVPA